MSRKSRRLALSESPSTTAAAPPPNPQPAPLPPLLSDPKLRRWLPIVALAVLAFAFLSPALSGVYIWDDQEWLTNNPVISQPGMYSYIWTDFKATPQYYPLVFTTFWLEYRMWKFGPPGPDGQPRGVGYHFDNILLHTLSAILIYIILKRLKLPGGAFGAWLSAAIFAIHPVNVESVAWVVERKNCLCGVFFFASLLLGLRFFNVTEETKKSRLSPGALYALALLLFIAAMFSKTIASVLPPVFLLLIWFRRGKITLREILLTLPFFAIAVALGALTAHIEVTTVGSVGPEFDFSRLQRLLIAGTDLWFYIGKIFLPYPVMQVYPRFDIVAGHAVTNPLYYLAPVAYLALVILLFALRKKISRGPVTALLFFAGVLFPALGFITFYTMIFTYVADHYQYLACIGIIVLAVETLLWLLRQTARRIAAAKPDPALFTSRFYALTSGIVGSAILLALGLVAFGAAELYTDGESLWGFNLIHNQKSFVPYINLASLKLNQRPVDVKAAHDFLAAAIVVAPQDWRAYQTLGGLYLDMKRPEQGMELLTKAEALMPDVVRRHRADFFASRAAALAKNGASMIDRSDATYGPHYRLAESYAKNGQWLNALQEFQTDNHENPENIECIMAIGRCYYVIGDWPNAVLWYRRAADRGPRIPDAWYGLGKALLKENHEQEGQTAILKARDLDYSVVMRDPDTVPLAAEHLGAPRPPPPQ